MIRNFLIFLTLSVGVVQAFCQTPEQEKVFLSKVEKAYVAKDPKQFLALYCWDSVDKFMRDQIKEETSDEITNCLEKAELVPLDKDALLGNYTVNGVTYGMNLKPLKTLKLAYKIGTNGMTGMEVHVGLKGDGLMIIGAAALPNERKAGAAKSDDWEQWAKLNIQSEKYGTLTPMALESIARQFLIEKQIAVDNGTPIVDIIVCDTNRVAEVKFHKALNLVQVVEINSDLKATRTSEIKIATEK
jgi:hypothetical protein